MAATSSTTGANNGSLYVSSDSGTTWLPKGTGHDWNSVASSASGTQLVAIAVGGYLYTSVDSGVTWTQRSTVSGWGSAVISADGTKLVAVATSGVYVSTGPVP